MMDNFDNLVKLTKDLVNLTKKPCLILILPEINRASVLEIKKVLNNFKFGELDIIIQTPGGDPDSAYMIVKLLKDSSKNINIFVPLYSKSAGTLVCLSANTLYLSKIGELGPLDTQVREHSDGGESEYKSALNGFKALEQVKRNALEMLDNATILILQRAGLKLTETIKLAIQFTGNTSGKLYDQIDPKKIGEYARALDIGLNYGKKILMKYMGWQEENANLVMKRLVFGYPSHGYVIDGLELREIGLPVKDLDDNLGETIEQMSEEMRKLTKFAFIKLFQYNKESISLDVKNDKTGKNQIKKNLQSKKKK